MKSKQKKQADLEALTENFKNSNAAMVMSFTKLTVDKDQEFRNEIRKAGAKYGVVKNTLARLAVKETAFEEATEHFTGVTSVAWTDGEPVGLSKVISKYVNDDKDIFEFKTGIVDGKVIAFGDVETIASLPSKEELIGKLLFLINAPAQRLATALSAIPRDLASVVKQVSERPADATAETDAKEEPEKKDSKAEESKAEESKTESADEQDKESASESTSEDKKDSEASTSEAEAEESKAETADADDKKSEEEPEEAAADGGEAESADEVADDAPDAKSDSKEEGGDEPAEEESK